MRWIVGGASALGLVILTAGVLFVLVPAERVAALAAGEFQRLTGREMAIAGDVGARLWPSPGVTLENVTVADAAGAAGGPMLTADRIALDVGFSTLFGGGVRITGLQADGLRLVLARDADGRGNWLLAGGTEGGAAATPLVLDRVALADATLVWADAASGTRVEVADIAATLRIAAPGGSAEVAGTATVDGQAVDFTAGVASAVALLAGQVTEGEIRAGAGGTQATFKGRIGVAPAVLDGHLTADLADLRALAALTGIAMPTPPEGLGAQLRQVGGALTLAPPGSLHLRDGAVTLDGNRLDVAADITFDGPRPKIAAQIDAGAVLVPGLVAPATGGTAASPADAVWPRDAIDVSALALADAEIAFRADSVTLGGTSLGRTRLLVSVERSRAVIEAREMQVFGGNIGGQFVVNGRGGLSVGGDLTFAGIAVQPLLVQVAGYDRLVAAGDLQVQFLGVGNSVAAIMASLSGAGRVALGRGELRGFDLLGMLRTLDPGHVGDGLRTVFDGVAAGFTIDGGKLLSDDLRLTAPFLRATAQGEVGLGAQVLDVRITPTALTKADGTGAVAVPLLVTGPWTALQFRLDLKALVDRELAEERARAEAAAKAAADLAAPAAADLAAPAAADLAAPAAADLAAPAAEEVSGILPEVGLPPDDAARRHAEQVPEEQARELPEGLVNDN